MVFIIAQLPPAVCGVGDYSMNLIEELRLEPAPHFLLMRGALATRCAHPDLDLEEIPMDAERLARRLAELGARCVVVEYVAQGFQARGCPLWLLDALKQWRQTQPGARLVMMFHELWFRAPWWKPDFALQLLHRRAIRRLAPEIDQAFVTTAGYARWLSPWFPPARLRVLPNATNIIPVETPRVAPRDAGTWALFGRQGSRLSTLEAMGAWLGKLHEGGRLVRLQVLGSRESDAMNRREDALLRSMLPEGAYELLGLQSPPHLSKLLGAAEFGLFSQSSASITKSGVFMAYASHGMNILTPSSSGETEPPQCWLTHPSELLETAASPCGLLTERARHLLEWYEQNASWPRLAAAYREAMKIPAPGALAP